LFNIKPDIKEIKNKIKEDGFFIINNCIEKNLIKELREYWLNKIQYFNKSKKHVGGNLYFGEENFVSFSKTRDYSLYRHFDFLWNKEESKLSRQINTEVHKIRNQIQDFEINTGLEYSSDCFGFYISTSFYPSNSGRMREHVDQHEKREIINTLIPLTYKGTDWTSGGLFLMNRKGDWVDVDEVLDEGALVFFDAGLKHKVEMIKSSSNKQVGRIGVIAIPTYFIKNVKIPVFKRSLMMLNRDVFNLPITLARSAYKNFLQR
jgi:hypothetical protein